MPAKRRKKRAGKKSYSTGELNRMADAVIHPFYRKNQTLRFVDGAIHAIIEQNPKTSARKFIKYNLPDLVKEILKKL